MAQLSKILGSILRDMVSAQHESNMYALKLSNAYRIGNQAATIRPPAVCFGEVELMLHCGFAGESSSVDSYEIDYAMLVRTIKELSSELSDVIVSSILSTITQNKNDEEDKRGPISRLNSEKTIRRNYIAYLSRKLSIYLQSHRDEFIASDGSVDSDALSDSIMYISDAEFLSHPDMETVFFSDETGLLRNKVRDNLQNDLKIILPRLLEQIKVIRRSTYTSLDVVVSSEELAKLPEECIQTFRLRISPRDLPTEMDTE